RDCPPRARVPSNGLCHTCKKRRPCASQGRLRMKVINRLVDRTRSIRRREGVVAPNVEHRRTIKGMVYQVQNGIRKRRVAFKCIRGETAIYIVWVAAGLYSVAPV